MRTGQAQHLLDLRLAADKLGNRLWNIGRRQDRSGLRRCRPRCGFLRARRQSTDFPGELVTASGDRADQVAFRAQGGAQGGNLRCQTVFFDDAARPHTRHQRVFADDGSVRLDQHHQHVEGSPAEFDGPAVSEQLAAVWQ